MVKKRKPKAPPEPFYNCLVSVWFDFCRQNKGAPPSFDGSSPRDLKNIIHQLRIRCESSGKIWDEETAKKRLTLFLEEAYKVKYLQDNWLLMHINRQKDIIFYKIAQERSHG